MNTIFENHKKLIQEHTIQDVGLKTIVKEIQTTYLSDSRPWIIGFSGGKDSTTVLSLIYYSIQQLTKSERTKRVYVVTSDTLVETPLVVDLIKSTLELVESQAKKDNLPISCHTVYPKTNETFWVNLLGKGYPAPQQTFRWCTERMKINPVSEFIKDKVDKHGEVILALGARSDESSSRAQIIESYKIKGSVLNRHSSLNNAYTYLPISTWSADDVWEYLLYAPPPWGDSNLDLFYLYKGSNQGECPMVIDRSTPSCGNSRFGCWTCTVVKKDRAMESLIQTGETWMKPLLEFRDILADSTKPENKSKYRNYKRRSGYVTYKSGDINNDKQGERKNVPGPYWLKTRKDWLKKLLEIEKQLNEKGNKINLISNRELEAIRKEWIQDPNEPDWEDSLPKIYKTVYPDKMFKWIKNDVGTYSSKDIELLKMLSKENNVSVDMLKKLIEAEIKVTGLGRRNGIYKNLETILRKDWGQLELINERNQKTNKAFGVWENELYKLKKEREDFVQMEKKNS